MENGTEWQVGGLQELIDNIPRCQQTVLINQNLWRADTEAMIEELEYRGFKVER